VADPTLEDYALRLDVLILKALEIPGRKASAVVLFQIALALQARDLVSAGFFLSKHRHLTASWLCVRSLSELVIRMKWLGKSHSRFCCLIIGEEVAEHRRLMNERQPHKLKKAAIKAVSERLDWFLSTVPKRGPYWDKRRKQFRRPPTVKVMAQQANALSVYNKEFRYSSWHVHSSTRIFTHAEMSQVDPKKLKFQIEAAKDAEVPPDRSLFNLYLRAIFTLQRCGFPIDDQDFARIGNDFGIQHRIKKAQTSNQAS
jgi:Family of unknown function (DUF5677)